MPLLSNNRNHENWPSVVSQDILRHVHQLKNNVYVISGQVKGRTLLPLPVGAEKAAFIESSQARLVLQASQYIARHSSYFYNDLS